MIRKKSAGVIIYTKDGRGIRYLLLHHGGQYWNFAKGTQEKGEADLQTALRELEEETGITEVKIIDGFLESYDYDFDTEIKNGVRQKVYKTVIFYLGEVKQDKIVISDEHLDYGWFDFTTAHQRLFFQNGQDLLQKANQFLLKKQDFVL
ncbi:MAG: NUDIX domain-containing protein [Patescibacteria group bacterium]|jgi:8-oxo-dGTP pyrophosphatase MutT (NUDIX family)